MTENQKTILKAVDTICDPVKATLGTKGRTALYNTFIEAQDKPVITKDGASIAKYIRSDDGYENMVISVVRESSLKTMLSAGDGTTTTCIIAQELIHKGMELMNAGVSYYEVSKAIDEAVVDIKKYIYDNTIYVNDDVEMLKLIASISANDEKIGEMIYKIVNEIGLFGNIQVETSMFTDTRIETTKGMKLHKGWLDASMCNNVYKETFEADNCSILIFDGELRDWNSFFDYVKELDGEQLVVFCDDISEAILSKLKSYLATSKAPLCFVENDGYLERKKMLLDDLAIITGGRVVKPTDRFNEDNLGFCDSILVTKTNVSIIGGYSYEDAVEEKIEELKMLLESDRISCNTEMSNIEKLFYQRRLANFTGGVAIIRVGGRTQIEIKELKDRIEDAVLAVESAIREGVSYGGGYTFLNCAKHLRNSFLSVRNNKQAYDATLQAIEAPFKQLLINSDLYSQYNVIKDKIIFEAKGFDLRNNDYKDLIDYQVYDATAVISDALSNGVAVAKSLLSVKELIYEGIRKQ